MVSWRNFLENVVDDFKNKGYNFKHVGEIFITTIAIKMEVSYDFYVKHNLNMIEWKLNAKNNKNENLLNNINRNWRHPLKKKFESYRFYINNYNIRIWNKTFKSKHKLFRFRRSLSNVKPDQDIKTRYVVLIKVSVYDNLVLYIMPS